jgi:multicomponent Na+:H+ antiporter subunit G
MTPWRELAISLLLVSGSLLMLIASIGLLRFPDVYCRGHAQNKSMTLGMVCLLSGLWIFLGYDRVGGILFTAMIAQFTTIPIAGHMVALISFKKNVARYREKPMDDPFSEGTASAQDTSITDHV